MRLLAVLLLLSIGRVASAGETTSCTLRMAVETDFPPHIVKQSEQWTGLSIELMQRLAAEVNCQLVFINTPWLRSLQLSEQGRLDVLSHLSFNQQRRSQFAFIGPHHIESIYLVGNPKLTPKLDNLQQLADGIDLGSIATLHGAYYGEEFEQLTLNASFANQLVSISSIQDKLALLRAGRVKVILEDLSVVRYWQQHQYDAAEQFQPLLKVYESPVYFGFSKTSLSAERLNELANAWQHLHQQGELTAIYQKYQLSIEPNLAPDSRL